VPTWLPLCCNSSQMIPSYTKPLPLPENGSLGIHGADQQFQLLIENLGMMAIQK
jgi:hypothetical protein